MFWEGIFFMLTIKQTVGNVVATDTQATVHTLDTAIANQTRMISSIIDAAHDSNMPIVTTQQLLESLASGLNKMVDGRAHLAQAVKEIVTIQGHSNLRETSFGCPNGFYKLSDVSEQIYSQHVE
jgi:hypothetical protein